MAMRPAIGWADLLLAVDRLAADGHDGAVVSALLGMEFAPPTIPDEGADANPGHTSHEPSRSVVEEPDHSGETSPEELGPYDTENAPSDGQLELEAQGIRQPAWDWKADLPADLPGSVRTRPTAVVTFQTLFEPRHERQIILQMLKCEVDGALDAEALVEHLARRRLPRVLPRRRQWVANRPVQVLADAGDGMVPFAQDRNRLLQRLRDLLGPTRCLVVHIDTRPPMARRSPRCSPGPYSLPAPGTPVLIISDFGIGRFDEDAVLAAWRPFADLCRGRNPVIALVPRSQADLAALPGDWLTLSWDRSTVVSTVCRRRSSVLESGR